MLIEALVITVCVGGYDGCGQATSAYYEQSTKLKAISKRIEQIGKRITRDREWLVYAATPIYAVASRQPAKILIYRGTAFSLDPWKQTVGLQWSY